MPVKPAKCTASLVALALLLVAGPACLRSGAQTSSPRADDVALKKTYDRCVADAVRHLRAGQRDDGSYHDQADPGVTALATTALLRQGVPPDDPTVARSLKYLEGFIRDSGGIHRKGTFYRNYETCLAMLCFVEANTDGRYDEILRKANAFVHQLQWDEGEGQKSQDLEYGGAGYGRHKRPDLSNTQFMIEALLATGDEANSEAIQRALAFVSRCQNLDSEHNTTEFAKKNPDGGFYYTPASGGVSQAGELEADGGLRSYGSMTYAGLKSMIYAGVDAEDQRVQAAVEWISRHYDITTNPGMGDAGLFYYYHTFAKALEALGQQHLAAADGSEHDWREDLITELARRQRKDGAWVNQNQRWLEGDANLVTAYALLALAHARPE